MNKWKLDTMEVRNDRTVFWSICELTGDTKCEIRWYKKDKLMRVTESITRKNEQDEAS